MIKAKFSNPLLGTALLLTAFLCLGWADTWEGIKKAASTITSVSSEFVQVKHMEIFLVCQ